MRLHDSLSLENLGWNAYFESLFLQLQEELDAPSLVPARVTEQHRGAYVVATECGAVVALLPGKTLHLDDDEQIPAVGDWVAAHPLPNEAKAVIVGVLPRRTRFVRQSSGGVTRHQTVAANIDTVFLVSGLDHDFNPRRIERYLTLAWESGAVPVVLLNKADLCDALEERIGAVEAVAPGVSIHPISAALGTGLEALDPYLAQGRTVAFLGSSGVGKSSLVNRLLGRDELAVGDVREDDSRGRHTTTHRELVVLPGAACLIDTPGMRELQLTGGASLDKSFADVRALAEECRFADCTHQSEPGCAIQGALTDGVLDSGRYGSYQKQLRELAYAERRESDVAAREHRIQVEEDRETAPHVLPRQSEGVAVVPVMKRRLISRER